MSSALYRGEVLSVDGPVLRYRLTIAHQDVNEFGLGPTFGWRLLLDWVSPEGEVDDEEAVNVKRFIKGVKVGRVEDGAAADKTKHQLGVRRTSEAAAPSLVYTIEVTDPRLLEGVKVGDKDDVYADSSPPQPAARKPARKAGAKRAPAPPQEKKTFDDFRRAALEIVREWRERTDSPSESIIDSGQLLTWSRSADDASVKAWLGYLDPQNQVRGAGVVALARLRAGRLDSARDFLRLAESSFVAPEEGSAPWLPGTHVGERSLIPAWWCFGQAEKAATAFEPWRAYGITHFCYGAGEPTLFNLAAEGRRYDLAREFLPGAIKSGREEDRVANGLLAVLEDGQDSVFDELMGLASEASTDGNVDYYLSVGLMSLLWNDPARYLEFVLAWPKVLRPWRHGSVALWNLERSNPARAVEIAATLLANPGRVRDYLELEAVAALGTHAPERAAAWAKEGLTTSTRAREYRGAYLAALGRNDEARENDEGLTAFFTSDPALAIEGLKRTVSACTDLCQLRHLLPLVDLGERAFVDAYLESKLAELRSRPASKRDSDCRSFAELAAWAGRQDLAFASIKLPTPSVRYCTTSSLVKAAAGMGDFATALAALELVPKDHQLSAVREGLQSAQRAFAEGPRALPLRVVSDVYARSLAAAAVGEDANPYVAPG